MSRSLRLLTAALLIAIFPIQGLASVVMTGCQHTEHAAAVAGGDHCEQHDATGVDAPVPAGDNGVAGIACEQCPTCHLSCFSVAPAAVSPAVVDPATDPQRFLSFHVLRLVPEQPQRPPLA